MTADVRQLRTPPHSVEAEQSLLGALMLDPRAWSRLRIRLGADDFFRADHRLIFAAIEELHRRTTDADTVAVRAYLERAAQLEAAGGADYVAQLAEDTPSASNVDSYARIVRERSTLRRLLDVGSAITRSVLEPGDSTPDELVANANKQLLRLQEVTRSGRGLRPAAKLTSELLDDLDRRRDGACGLSIGLSDFDEFSNGLEPGDLAIFAGRPGMGKTALLISAAVNAARSTGVVIFSAEMSSKQLMRRCLALVSEVQQGKLRRADKLTDKEWDAIARASGSVAKLTFWIDDTPAPTLDHIRAEILALRSQAKIGLALVDYAQLVQGRGATRYEQLREVAYGLKNLAKEAQLPIILLAQINRGVEARDVKRARLSDLRDSGAFEEAADIVGMLYSESYYNHQFGMPYVLECTLEKNRDGEQHVECLWRFSGAYSRVEVLDEGARAQYQRLRAQLARRGDGDDL